MYNLEGLVEIGVRANCPFSHSINEKAIKGIVRGIIRNGGECPCHHDEWDDNTPTMDKVCPCITFRTTGECHCNLYIKKVFPNIE